MRDAPGSLLCVANFPANAGYAWDFIERLYARIADHVVTHGIGTLVAYPAIPAPPYALMGSTARPVRLDASLNSRESVQATADLIRRENVRVVYLTDRPAWHWSYLRLRHAGAQRIIVHDHTSGERTRPRGLKRAAKWMLARIPGVVADVVVAVSDYVARRQVEVGLIPPARVVKVWNGMPVIDADRSHQDRANEILALPAGRPLIVCACRASPEKGIAYLLRAFDRVIQDGGGSRRPFLLYVGDGPQLAELQSLRETLQARDDIILSGYRPDAAAILSRADICVVPSVWHEAFPLAVLEAMALGKAIVATRVGGIPEMVEHNTTGLLVAPGDETALAAAIRQLLMEPIMAAHLGQAARRRVAHHFSLERQLLHLVALVEMGFGTPCDGMRLHPPSS